MKTLRKDYSKRVLYLVGIMSLVFMTFLTMIILAALKSSDDSLTSDVQDVDDLSDQIDEYVDKSMPNNIDLNVNLDVSDIPNNEPEHGWIINEFGYTYIYGDSGYRQFNYKISALQRYVDTVNAISELIPEDQNIYNITVPISTTFADIPKEIYKSDNFFNLSQSAFASTVAAKLTDRITDIPVVKLLEDSYDSEEYVYFRTDSNWTSLGAYKAYKEFCEKKNLTAFDINEFKTIELGNYLGDYYRATSSSAMYNNPDQFVAYSTINDVSTKMTIYHNEMIYSDYKLCENDVGNGNKYDVFLGRQGGRYSISSNAEGGSLLIIGDSSVPPILPFLASHYKEIDYINPEIYNKSFGEFINKHDFDDVLLMCYTTNAVSGSYVPSLSTFIGEFQNE